MSNQIVVIGGTNIDIVAQTKEHLVLHDSNPGSLTYSFGGVANNIAQNIAKLNLNPSFLTVIGTDQFGKEYESFANKININLIAKNADITPVYLAIINHEHDLEVAVAAMDSLSLLDETFLFDNKHVLDDASIIVVDTNLEEKTLKFIFNNYNNKEIYVESVSTFKVKKIIPYLDKISHLKVNFKEAITVAKLDEHATIEDLITFFKNSPIKNTYITDGSKGSYHIKSDNVSQYVEKIDYIENTSGAGDAFFAGVIYANINKLDPLKVGTAMSFIALESKYSVSEKLNENYLLTKLKGEKL